MIVKIERENWSESLYRILQNHGQDMDGTEVFQGNRGYYVSPWAGICYYIGECNESNNLAVFCDMDSDENYNICFGLANINRSETVGNLSRGINGYTKKKLRELFSSYFGIHAFDIDFALSQICAVAVSATDLDPSVILLEEILINMKHKGIYPFGLRTDVFNKRKGVLWLN